MKYVIIRTKTAQYRWEIETDDDPDTVQGRLDDDPFAYGEPNWDAPAITDAWVSAWEENARREYFPWEYAQTTG